MRGYVDEITNCWIQAPLQDTKNNIIIHARDKFPDTPAVELQFTPLQSEGVVAYLNSLSSECWNKKGGVKKFCKGHEAVRHLYLRCVCSGERKIIGTRKREKYSKQCGCDEACINVSWESANATFCTVDTVIYTHVGHPSGAGSEVGGGDIDSLNPTERKQLVDLNFFAVFAQNPARKAAMSEAMRITGRYVNADAIDYVLRKASKERDRQAEEKSAKHLEKVKEVRKLLLEPEDIMWRSNKNAGGDSHNLFSLLRELHVQDPTFKFMVEFGLPTTEQIIEYTPTHQHTPTHQRTNTQTHTN